MQTYNTYTRGDTTNIAYANHFAALWNTTSTELQYSQLMQTIPTASISSTTKPADTPTTSESVKSPSLFRPYNQYPVSKTSPKSVNGIGVQNDGTYKSAFKPVRRPIPSIANPSTAKATVYPTESIFYSTPNVTIKSMANNNTFNYVPTQMSFPYEPHLYRDMAGNPLPKIPKIVPTSDVTMKSVLKPYAMPTQQSNQTNELAAHKNSTNLIANSDTIQIAENNSGGIINPFDNVYHWDTLLPLVPEPDKHHVTATMPPEKQHTLTRKRPATTPQYTSTNENNVTIIDLTSNEEDFDDCIPSSLIESCRTPPLDINGNEILVSTNTRTMEAVTYKKASEITSSANEMQQEKQMPVIPKSIQNAKSTKTPIGADQPNCPILFANLTNNSFRVPPKEQLKFMTKYNRYMGHFRKLNGFRLFVQRHHMRAQSQAPRNGGKPFVHNTLLQWWNSLSPASREQYAQMSDIMHTQKTSATKPTSKDDTPSISIIPIFDDSTNSNNTTKAANVSVERQSNVDVTTVNLSNKSNSSNNNSVNTSINTSINSSNTESTLVNSQPQLVVI